MRWLTCEEVIGYVFINLKPEIMEYRVIKRMKLILTIKVRRRQVRLEYIPGRYVHLYIERPGRMLPGRKAVRAMILKFQKIFESKAVRYVIDRMSKKEKRDFNFRGGRAFFVAWEESDGLRLEDEEVES